MNKVKNESQYLKFCFFSIIICFFEYTQNVSYTLFYY
ncbi:Protein of unknown function (DUF2031), putative [Plasmodium berghei]|uniref:Uncharacterized protein n=1 Tax=Plasmodium berghei TaxID=5821 RepID=A0A1C6WFE7_PLABE|nr:Protein of unknown function (DUF2031), putative [Plasmodium berghei]SBW38344.1 Protein of unknown function (DUF2031), putative [Plasmodium berghei]SCL83778.1 Protein of unknown function (DUF2031), putative [Plasmodium berghei]SCL83869.1 Protein of unknown function (DUF2031), putative [Plasmodium berghei]SCL86244.1 Protein of unknown function (DUF2031), putative [Plasmodium berghei]